MESSNGKKSEVKLNFRKTESTSDVQPRSDKKTVIFGIIYSISIIFILLLIISFLFLSERDPEEIEGPYEPDVLITNSDYPAFFNNDTIHFPPGMDSVDGERCTLCHETTPSSGARLAFEKDDLKIYISSSTNSANKCFKCQVDPKHDTRSPYNQCTECHYSGTIGGEHNVLSLSFNEIIARVGNIDNEFCNTCHKAECPDCLKMGQPHEGTCTTCHNDHSIIPGCLDCHDPALEDPLPVGPYHYLGSKDFEICTNCHLGGSHTRPVINDDMDCSICHSNSYEYELENFGGRHFTFPTLGQCSSCHTDHKIFPDCHECHGEFPAHLNETAVADPNQDCRVCHTGGAHDSRVEYSNYLPELGDTICEVCHAEEYDVYYDLSTPGEIEIYGNCLNCHEEHNTDIKVPHMTPDNFLDCEKCHIGYKGPDTMHIISNTSFLSFPYTDVPSEFCSNCHPGEYNLILANSTPEFEQNYGGCTNCHVDHKAISYSHFVEGPFTDCVNCHKTYNSKISIHNPLNITYGDVTFVISNEFCKDCHETQYTSMDSGIHESRSCTDCHSDHYERLVDYDKCTLCHTDIPIDHDETKTDCGNTDCHDTSLIHAKSN